MLFFTVLSAETFVLVGKNHKSSSSPELWNMLQI